MRKGIRTRTKDGEGFTLIELLVVVLILGILMAIAIPTFLSLTSTSKSGAAESDLTAAALDEAGYEATYGDFDGTAGGSTTATAADNVSASSTPPGMIATDPGFNWTYGTPAQTASVTGNVLAGTAGKKTIYVFLPTTTPPGATILLATAGQNGTFYWLQDATGVLTYGYSTAAVNPANLTLNWATSWKTMVSPVS